MGVETTRVGHHPELSRPDVLGLTPQRGMLLTEGVPKGGYPGHRHHPGGDLGDKIDETIPASAQLLPAQFRSTHRGTWNQVGDADPRGGEGLTLGVAHPRVGVEGPIDQSCSAQRWVEAVGGVAEMGLGRGCPQTRIDAYEEESTVVTYQVRNGDPAECLQLFLAEAQGYFFWLS